MDIHVFSGIILVILALGVGISKTAIPGITSFIAAMIALIIPARESTALLLIWLLVGDLLAITMYRHVADWAELKKLFPSVIVGVVFGSMFLYVADNTLMRHTIGVITLVLAVLNWWVKRRRSADDVAEVFGGRHVSGFYGFLGGFTSMAANAGGPPMALYFLARGFDVMRFLGTNAWFFFLLNVVKLPFSAGIGLIDGPLLVVGGIGTPIVIGGALLGRIIARGINVVLFQRIILMFTIIAAVALIAS